MKKIKKINLENIIEFKDLIKENASEFSYFDNIGWSFNQYVAQIKKKINHSFILYEKNKIIGFILGDLINVEKKLEYEILLIYVDRKHRKKGNATLLLEYISKTVDNNLLQKISLEVAENNFMAIDFYKKNNFAQVGFRKKYYSLNSKEKIDGLIFEKKINE